MKIDFKKAAKKYATSSMLMFAMAAGGLAYGGAKAFDYYRDSPEKAAYAQCLEEKKPCTPDQITLAKAHVDAGAASTIWLIMPQIWFMMGLGYRKDEKHKQRQKALLDEKHEVYAKYIEQSIRATELGDKLEAAERQLAPYLAEADKKAAAEAEAAAKQQLNQIAADATTLQGKIKVAKKPIALKQPPPAQP